jgi:hypothetical protein
MSLSGLASRALLFVPAVVLATSFALPPQSSGKDDKRVTQSLVDSTIAGWSRQS